VIGPVNELPPERVSCPAFRTITAPLPTRFPLIRTRIELAMLSVNPFTFRSLESANVMKVVLLPWNV
jgi:hypothetical protein